MATEPQWRTLALIAGAGWLLTALAWGLSTPEQDEPHTRQRPAPFVLESRPHEGHRAARRVRHERPRMARSEASPVDRQAVREEVREEVMAELEAEREKRREERTERRLNHLMERIGEFVVENELDPSLQGELESVMLDAHDKLEEMRPRDGRRGPPTEDEREAFLEVFDELEVQARATLDDEAMAASFKDWVLPPHMRERR